MCSCFHRRHALVVNVGNDAPVRFDRCPSSASSKGRRSCWWRFRGRAFLRLVRPPHRPESLHLPHPLRGTRPNLIKMELPLPCQRFQAFQQCREKVGTLASMAFELKPSTTMTCTWGFKGIACESLPWPPPTVSCPSRAGSVLILVPDHGLDGKEPHPVQEIIGHVAEDRIHGRSMVRPKSQPGNGEVPGASSSQGDAGRCEAFQPYQVFFIDGLFYEDFFIEAVLRNIAKLYRFFIICAFFSLILGGLHFNLSFIFLAR